MVKSNDKYSDLALQLKELKKENELLVSENARLKSKFDDFQSIQREKTLTQVILRVAGEILHTRSFDQAAELIFNAVKDFTEADAGYIALLNKETGMNDVVHLEPGSQVCTVDHDLPMPIRGFRAVVYKEKTVKYHNDFKNTSWNRLMPKGHTTLENVMFVPMIDEGEAIGLIGLANKTGGFTDEDARLTQEFGNLAVIALKYSRSQEENHLLLDHFRNLFYESPIPLLEIDFTGFIQWIAKRGGEVTVKDMINESLNKKEQDEMFSKINISNSNEAFNRLIEKKENHHVKIEKIFNADTIRFLTTQIVKTPDQNVSIEFEANINTLAGEKKYVIVNQKNYDLSESHFYKLVLSLQDITDRSKKEEARKTAQQLLQQIVDQVPVMIWMSDTTGKCNNFNKRWLSFTGRTLEQEMGDGWAEGVHPDDLDFCVNTYLNAFKKQKEFNMEYRLKHYSGEYRWIWDIGVPRYSESGQFQGYLGCCYDITDKKNYENALKESEEKFRLIIDALPQFISYCSNDFKYKLVNKAYEEEFGFSKDELVDKPIKDVIGKETFDQAYDHMQKVTSGEYVRYYEKFIYKSGSTKHIDGQLIPKKDKHGNTTGYFGVLTDITPYMETREALEKSEKEKSLILDSMSEIVSFLDKDMNLLYVNKAAKDFIGEVDDSKILNEKCFTAIWHKNSRCDHCVVHKTLKTGESQQEDIAIEKYHFNVRAYPVFNEKNEISGAVEFVKDITDQKNKDEEIKRMYNLYRTLASNLPGINVFLFDDQKRILIAEGSEIRQNIYPQKEFEGKLVTELNYNREVVSKINDLYDGALHGKRMDKQVHYNHKWYQMYVVPISNARNKIIGGLSVAQNITQQKEMATEIEISREKLKQLSLHLQNLIEEEKSHLAREIHDELGQKLTYIKLNLAMFYKKMSSEMGQVKSLQLKNSYEMVDKMIKKVREISSELRPPMLDEIGLLPALEYMVSDFQNKSGVHCNLKSNKDEVELTPQLAINIYRVVQEALTNCMRHSKAGKINIEIQELKRKLKIRIKDNGKGIKLRDIQSTKSFGLSGMRERVELFKGEFSIKGEEGKGTTITIEIPHERN